MISTQKRTRLGSTLTKVFSMKEPAGLCLLKRSQTKLTLNPKYRLGSNLALHGLITSARVRYKVTWTGGGRSSFRSRRDTKWRKISEQTDCRRPGGAVSWRPAIGLGPSSQALADLVPATGIRFMPSSAARGMDSDEALDLTQDYFDGLLEKGTVAAADPGKGRFRTFLLADCTHFLSHRREHDRANKRGGGVAALSIDARDAEGRYLREPTHSLTPERLFERDWAMALLDRVLARLRREYRDSGRGTVFDTLKAVLSDDPRAVPQAELAAGWASAPARSRSPCIVCANAIATWSVRRSPRRSPMKPRSRPRSATSSPLWDRDFEGIRALSGDRGALDTCRSEVPRNAQVEFGHPRKNFEPTVWLR